MAINGDDMNDKLGRVEGKLGRVEGRLERVEKKVDGLKIEFEQVRDDIKKLGEGYEHGLTQISRQIEKLDSKWSHKWGLHDMALRDHGKRISTLERK